MAIVKEIEIRVQDQQAQQGITKLNDLFKQVDQSVEKAESTSMSLRAELRKLQQDMASGRLSGAEFNEAAARAGQLRDAIGDVNARVNVLASDTQALDAAMSLGSGVAGAFSVATGTMAMFGDESEEVQQAILKVQSSLAILNGVQAVANTLNKDSALMIQLQTRGLTLLTGAQKAYSLVVGTSTGALKAFRIALISTGIGAIVVAVGLLIANFEKISKWVTDLIDKFGGWRKVLMFVAPPIWGIIKALEALGIIDDEQTAQNKKNSEERIKNSRKESKELDRKKTEIGAYYDFEIRKAKAAGKNTEEVEEQKRAALLQTLLAQNALERAWIRTSAATEEDIKRWNARQAAITQLLQDIQIAEIESTRKTEDEKEKIREKQRQAAEKRRAEEKKRIEQEAAEEYRIFEESTKARDKALEEQRKRREELLKMDEDEEMAKMDAEIEAMKQHSIAMREAQANAYELELEARQAFEDAKFNIAAQGIALLSSLFGRSKNMAKAILVLEQSLAIAQVVSNAARAIAQAKANLAATPAVIGVAPNPMYAVQAAATAKGIATTKIAAGLSIATILAQTVGKLSNGGNLGGGGSGGGGGAGSVSAPSFNLVGDAGMNQIAQGQAGQQPVEAYVVAGNVTTAQSLNRNIINNSTF
jgi:membrane protein involved in colicin uptake